MTGEELALRAEDGARLEGTLSESGVEGTATLADGQQLDFTAQPATGIAGLYTVTFAADGQLQGISAAGGTVTGQVDTEAGTPGATPAAGSRLVMRVTGPQGATAQLEARAVPATSVEAGTARLIVLAEGQLRGKRTKDSKGDQGYIDPNADL